VQLTLEQLLSVVGLLDDAPGFDTPRERFRRFVTKRVADFATARQLVEQCIHLPGGQSHRALEDLVISLGRFLELEVVFGSYQHSSILAAGGWRARRQVFIHVAVWTDQTPATEIARLTNGTAPHEPFTEQEGESHVGLGILTPLFPAATRLGDLKNSRGDLPLYTLSLRLLLQLTEMVVEKRVSQSFALALFTRSPMLDELVGELEILLNARGAAAS